MWRQDALPAYMNYLMLYVLDDAQRKIIRPVAYCISCPSLYLRRKTRRTVLFVCFFTAVATNLATCLSNMQESRQRCSLQYVKQCLFQTLKNIFFDVDIVVKNKSNVVERFLQSSSLALSTTIRVITVIKICCGLTWLCLVITQLLWWRISLSIRVQTTPHHIRFG